MRINDITIKNFRSISELNIKIQKIADKSCSIFLGKNETGKSNILKAISLLNEESEPNYSIDCNKAAYKSKADIEVSFNMLFEDKYFNWYMKQLHELDTPKELTDKVKFLSIIRKIIISSSNNKEDNIYIKIAEDNLFQNFVIDHSQDAISKKSDEYDGEEEVTDENIGDLIGEDFEVLNSDNFSEYIATKMSDLIKRHTPKIIFWQPDDKFLINEKIDLSSFSSNPSISIPLRNMFKITEIEDIEARIKLIENENTEERLELQQDLSEKVTNYINKIWPEHKVKIIVAIENMRCKVLVEDKSNTTPKYQMDQRSDGFKQFISILLTLSIENNTEQIKDCLILLDEPEIHLHPSSVRYLRDELLNIAQNNTVFISSHSIYMVDKKSLDRHYQVDKEDGITAIKQIDKNNPYEEEVIYEALGTSIYEQIEPFMLVFEGKTDKDLFDAFSKKYKRDLDSISLTTISADGVDKVPQYTKFMDGKWLKGFVLVDSDKKGTKVKNDIIKNNKSFTKKNTLEINDIVKTGIEATLEDLYPKELIVKLIAENYSIDIQLDDTPVMEQIKKKNKTLKGKLPDEEVKSLLVNGIIKDISGLNKIKTKEKYPTYYKFIEKLHKKLKA